MNKPTIASERRIDDVIRRWPTPRSRIWTANLLDEVADNDEVVAIVGIGSAVRADVPSVDLDLLMISNGPVELKKKPPVEIDLRIYDVAQVTEEIAKGNDLLGWAVNFGRVLFERDDYWTTLVHAWNGRLPFPPADVAARRAEEAYGRLLGLLDVGDSAAAREQALSYVTHLGRSQLLSRHVYPASRPELPAQLRAIGSDRLAGWLKQLMNPAGSHTRTIAELQRNHSVSSGVDRPPASSRRGLLKRR
jgi:hypothetical protein